MEGNFGFLFRPACFFWLSYYKACYKNGYLSKLRAAETARYELLSSVRQQMGRAGACASVLASRRLKVLHNFFKKPIGKTIENVIILKNTCIS